MGRIEELAARYQAYISAPWQRDLAGAQRVIFVVHDKADERKLRAKLDLFEVTTRQAGHGWRLFDFTAVFARWMADMDYRDRYFAAPERLSLRLERDFLAVAARSLREALGAEEVDEGTVVAVHGVASLFGLTKVSLVLKQVEHDIQGRLLLFFPGTFENNNYRLLDARDGWNYLAVPITLHGGVSFA